MQFKGDQRNRLSNITVHMAPKEACMTIGTTTRNLLANASVCFQVEVPLQDTCLQNGLCDSYFDHFSRKRLNSQRSRILAGMRKSDPSWGAPFIVHINPSNQATPPCIPLKGIPPTLGSNFRVPPTPSQSPYTPEAPKPTPYAPAEVLKPVLT